MPTFDTSMYHGNPLKSVSEYSREMAGTDFINSQVQQNQLAMQGTRLKNEQMLRLQAEHDQMVNALRSGQHDISTEPGRNKLQMAFPNTAPALIEQMGKGSQEFAKAGQASSAAAATDLKTKVDRHAFALQKLGMANDPIAAQQWIGEALQAGVVPFERVQANLDQLKQESQTPEGFAKWKAQMMQGGMTVQQQMEQQLKQQIANQPKMFPINTGTRTGVVGIDPKTMKPVASNFWDVEQSPNSAANERIAGSPQRPPSNVVPPIPKLGVDQRWNPDTQEVEIIPGSNTYQKQAVIHAKSLTTLNGLETKLTNGMRKIDDIIDPKKSDAFNSNFGGYNAYVTQWTPGNDTANMRNAIEGIKSDLKAAGLELMRSGGSIGQMTVQEWPIVQNMIANINPSLGEERARTEFQNVKDYMQSIIDKAKDVYNKEWGSTQFANGAKVPANAGAGPKVGDVIDGYRFKGGDPANQSNWEKM
jgi:hypothetical protein